MSIHLKFDIRIKNWMKYEHIFQWKLYKRQKEQNTKMNFGNYLMNTTSHGTTSVIENISFGELFFLDFASL